jgi:hypothetical protein
MSAQAIDKAKAAGAPAAPEAAAPKVKRFYSVGLKGDGGQLVRVTAARSKDGASSYATRYFTEGGKKRSEKGATERHPTFEKARERVEQLAAKLAKLGWWRPSGGSGGFKARPDAFDADHLPLPGAAAPKAGKTKK